MTLTRRAFLISTAAAAAMSRPARAAATASLGGPAFGSYWRLTLPEGAAAGPAAARIAALVAQVDARMSPYRAASDLGRFNRRHTTDPQPLTPETAAVTAMALSVAAETGGAFDPTVGPLVARYGFGPIAGAATGGFAELTLRDGALGKARPGLSLDLCGIAKGHALDRIGAALETLGHHDFLAELGGEVLARGQHPDGRAWRVGLDGAAGGLAGLLQLSRGAVATSGDAVQGYDLGGRRYGHIIDPARGAPARSDLVSVSVFDRSAARADALATALFAMGRAAGEGFARANGLEALFLTPAGRIVATGGAAAHLLPEVL